MGSNHVTKPFDLDILLAQVRAVVRKGKSATSVLTWESIQLDPDSGEVRCKDNIIHKGCFSNGNEASINH